MNDETLLKTVQNGLMIAGHEMGPVGDHWPAINAISKGVAEEFEKSANDQAVLGEIEFFLADTYRQMEEVAEKAPPQDRKKILDYLKTKWESYYAIFEPVAKGQEPDPDDLVIEGVNDYSHSRSALNILNMLGGRI